MRKTSRLISLFLAFVMTLSLAACSSGSKNEATTKQTTKAPTTAAYKGELMMATTTSTDDTGLLDYLAPLFRADTGWELKWTAVGTGDAIKLGQDGEVDIILVHAKAKEEAFVADGYGVKRYPVMYNDFVVVGPKDGAIKKTADISSVFNQIFKDSLTFVSRGDNSGTDTKEKGIWTTLKIDYSKNKNYVSAGAGMKDTLVMANEKKAYCLTDRGTWLTAKNDLSDLTIVCEGDANLLNQYGVIAVSPDKYADTNIDAANAFIKWICSDKVQKLIDKYGVDTYGEQLFHANAEK